MTAGRSLCVMAVLVAGCTERESAAPSPKTSPKAASVTNRVAVPAAVRQNLGITFAKAEERHVGQTLRLAGHFALPVSGRIPHHSRLAGTVRIHVSLLDRVTTGQLLASVTSAALLEHRHELHLASDRIGAAADALSILSERVRAATAALSYARKRNVELRAASARRADLEAKQAELQRRIRILRVQRTAKRHEVTRAQRRFDAELLAFSAVLGVPVAKLRQSSPADVERADDKPWWQVVEQIELRATRPGVVSEVSLSSGAWAEAGAKVVELHDPHALWLVARALNSDIRRLRDGQRVLVNPASPSTTTPGTPVGGTLQVGITGDLLGQTVPVYVMLDEVPLWAKPGIAAFVDVSVSTKAAREVAIPVGALVRDGLQTVFFRRDPDDPDKVIRVEADLGESDGRWVVVYSGIAADDQVVVDGAYELKLASSAKPSATGHFHADGTFHAEND